MNDEMGQQDGVAAARPGNARPLAVEKAGGWSGRPCPKAASVLKILNSR